MSKKNLNKAKEVKAETDIVKGTLTIEQIKLIESLVGVLGSNRQDVVGKILTNWLYENCQKNYVSKIMEIKKN